jgi:hypothetical protein
MAAAPTAELAQLAQLGQLPRSIQGLDADHLPVAIDMPECYLQFPKRCLRPKRTPRFLILPRITRQMIAQLCMSPRAHGQLVWVAKARTNDDPASNSRWKRLSSIRVRRCTRRSTVRGVWIKEVFPALPGVSRISPQHPRDPLFRACPHWLAH